METSDNKGPWPSKYLLIFLSSSGKNPPKQVNKQATQNCLFLHITSELKADSSISE
jgi:hypothetical protein